MEKYLLRISLLLALFMSCGMAHGQGFPWDDFTPRTLKEIVSLESDVDQRSPKEKTIVFHFNILSSKVRVIFQNSSRPISDTKKDLIRKWTKMMGNPESYANNYESEFLFTEDSVEYWLPVQKKVSSYFEKELKKGAAVDIYLVRAGGIRTNTKWDWMLLVEEFLKPKS